MKYPTFSRGDIYLYVGMFGADDAEGVWLLFANPLRDEVFCLFLAHFTIDGHHQIENHVDGIFTDRHTEIVDGKALVDRFRRAFRNVVHFIDKGIV